MHPSAAPTVSTSPLVWGRTGRWGRRTSRPVPHVVERRLAGCRWPRRPDRARASANICRVVLVDADQRLAGMAQTDSNHWRMPERPVGVDVASDRSIQNSFSSHTSPGLYSWLRASGPAGSPALDLRVAPEHRLAEADPPAGMCLVARHVVTLGADTQSAARSRRTRRSPTTSA